MRVIAEIPYPTCKVSIFYMNQKYLIKIEQGVFEQTYKISELDYVITGLEDIKAIINETFITRALEIFSAMQELYNDSLKDF
jgi:hypothetical protein